MTKVAMLVDYGLFVLASVLIFKPRDRTGRTFRAVVAISGGLVVLYFGYLTIVSDPESLPAKLSFGLFLTSIALFVCSLHWIGRRTIGFAGEATAPESIVTTGPYALARHPIYLAYMIGWLAGLLNASTVRQLIIGSGLVGVMATIYATAAMSEEKAIERSPVGAEYSSYRARTGMLFPRLIRMNRNRLQA